MMPIRRPVIATVAALTVLSGAALAEADATQFARVTQSSTGTGMALQTAIVTYVPRKDPQQFSVDLIAAVHLGDRRYYAELNDLMTQYDVLLYELVAPEGSPAYNREQSSKGMLSGAQLMLGRALDLSFQLDEIQYDAGNFVRADLTPDELVQNMKDRNESLYVYFWRLYFASMQEFSRDPYGVSDIARALSADGDFDVKTQFAYELADSAMAGDILAGETGSALIAARNERALEVMQQQLDARATRVGIFYGAAHLPDMEQRLVDDFDLVRARVEWVDAWQLGSAAAQ